MPRRIRWLVTALSWMFVLEGLPAAARQSERAYQTESVSGERFDEQLEKIVASLTSGRRVAAYAEFSQLALEAPVAPTCVRSIKNGFVRLAQLDEAKELFADALAASDRRRVHTVIEGRRLSDIERNILYLYADTYQGEFDRATRRLSALQNEFAEERGARSANLAARLGRVISDARNEYEKYGHWVEFLASSSRGAFHAYRRDGAVYVPPGMDERTSSVSPVDLRVIASTRLETFFEASAHLQDVSPLSDLAAGAQFLTTMYLTPYEEFEIYADELMSGLTVLELPFDTWSGTAILELSVTEKRLRGTSRSLGDFAPNVRDDWVEELEPFDLSVGDVTKISQSASFSNVSNQFTSVGVQVSRRPVFLELDPKGRIGAPVMFNDFTVVFGVEAAKQVMNKFGSYVLHWIGDESVAKRSRSRLVWPRRGGKLINLARGLTGQTVVFSRPTSRFEKTIGDRQAEQEAERAGWPERRAAQAFEVLAEERVASVVELLPCLAPNADSSEEIR